MEFYRNKKKAFMDIQRMISERKITTLSTLRGVILRRYGFSDTMVKRMLIQLKEEGTIEFDGDMVRYILYKPKVNQNGDVGQTGKPETTQD